jgi:hypothetical protein
MEISIAVIIKPPYCRLALIKRIGYDLEQLQFSSGILQIWFVIGTNDVRIINNILGATVSGTSTQYSTTPGFGSICTHIMLHWLRWWR